MFHCPNQLNSSVIKVITDIHQHLGTPCTEHSGIKTSLTPPIIQFL